MQGRMRVGVRCKGWGWLLDLHRAATPLLCTPAHPQRPNPASLAPCHCLLAHAMPLLLHVCFHPMPLLLLIRMPPPCPPRARL